VVLRPVFPVLTRTGESRKAEAALRQGESGRRAATYAA